MKGLIALAVFVMALLILGDFLGVCYGAENDEQVVIQQIEFFFRNTGEPRRKRMIEKSLKVVPAIVKYSAKYGVDPLLVACLITWESGWNPRPGKLGERGYMQVMPRYAKGFDLDTVDGQIEAGISRLRRAIDACGDVKRSLSHYASGRCISKSERTRRKIRYRVRYYQKVNEKFRGTNNE